MIRAVLFDLDGLLFDTETLFLKNVEKLMQQRGMTVSEDVLKTMIGTDEKQVLKLEQQYPGIQEVMKQYMDNRLFYFDQMFKEKGSADKKGLAEAVSYLEKHHLPYAIATGSYYQDIRHFMAHAGCELHPEVLVSARDEHLPGKPSHAVFDVAASKLNVRNRDALVVEDGKYGIVAAKRGGFLSVFIQDHIVPDEEMRASLQYRISDLSQLGTLIDDINKRHNGEKYLG